MPNPFAKLRAFRLDNDGTNATTWELFAFLEDGTRIDLGSTLKLDQAREKEWTWTTSGQRQATELFAGPIVVDFYLAGFYIMEEGTEQITPILNRREYLPIPDVEMFRLFRAKRDDADDTLDATTCSNLVRALRNWHAQSPTQSMKRQLNQIMARFALTTAQLAGLGLNHVANPVDYVIHYLIVKYGETQAESPLIFDKLMLWAAFFSAMVMANRNSKAVRKITPTNMQQAFEEYGNIVGRDLAITVRNRIASFFPETAATEVKASTTSKVKTQTTSISTQESTRTTPLNRRAEVMAMSTFDLLQASYNLPPADGRVVRTLIYEHYMGPEAARLFGLSAERMRSSKTVSYVEAAISVLFVARPAMSYAVARLLYAFSRLGLYISDPMLQVPNTKAVPENAIADAQALLYSYWQRDASNPGLVDIVIGARVHRDTLRGRLFRPGFRVFTLEEIDEILVNAAKRYIELRDYFIVGGNMYARQEPLGLHKELITLFNSVTDPLLRDYFRNVFNTALTTFIHVLPSHQLELTDIRAGMPEYEGALEALASLKTEDVIRDVNFRNSLFVNGAFPFMHAKDVLAFEREALNGYSTSQLQYPPEFRKEIEPMLVQAGYQYSNYKLYADHLTSELSPWLLWTLQVHVIASTGTYYNGFMQTSDQLVFNYVMGALTVGFSNTVSAGNNWLLGFKILSSAAWRDVALTFTADIMTMDPKLSWIEKLTEYMTKKDLLQLGNIKPKDPTPDLIAIQNSLKDPKGPYAEQFAMAHANNTNHPTVPPYYQMGVAISKSGYQDLMAHRITTNATIIGGVALASAMLTVYPVVKYGAITTAAMGARALMAPARTAYYWLQLAGHQGVRAAPYVPAMGLEIKNVGVASFMLIAEPARDVLGMLVDNPKAAAAGAVLLASQVLANLPVIAYYYLTETWQETMGGIDDEDPEDIQVVACVIAPMGRVWMLRLAIVCPPGHFELLVSRMPERPVVNDVGPLKELVFELELGMTEASRPHFLFVAGRHGRNYLLDPVPPESFAATLKCAAASAVRDLERFTTGDEEAAIHANITWNFRRALQGLLCVTGISEVLRNVTRASTQEEQRAFVEKMVSEFPLNGPRL